MNIEEIIEFINMECSINSISKKELSEQAGISINTFKKFENSKDIRLSTLMNILSVIDSKLIIKSNKY